MKDFYSGFRSIMCEMIWYLILQGIFFLLFATFVLFYPYALVIVVAFLLICLAVISIYFGLKIWTLKRKIVKFFK